MVSFSQGPFCILTPHGRGRHIWTQVRPSSCLQYRSFLVEKKLRFNSCLRDTPYWQGACYTTMTLTTGEADPWVPRAKQVCRRKLVYSSLQIPTTAFQGALQRDQGHLEQNRGQTSCLTTEIQILMQVYSLVFAMSWIYPCLSLILVCDPALFTGFTGSVVFIRAYNVPLLKLGL